MTKSLLLISAQPNDQAFAAEIALAAGLSLTTATDPREGALRIAQDEPAVIIADASTEAQYQQLENAIQETVGLFSDKINPNAIHFLSSEPLENVPYLIQTPLFGNFIIRNYGSPANAGKHYGRVINAAFQQRAYGLANLLKPGTGIQVVKFVASSQKQEAVEAIKNYLIQAKFQSRMAATIANAVDELLMNAMFDAPVDELGRPTLISTPRSTVLKLEGRSAVEMQVGFDGEYAGITAIDLFGSLDKAKLLYHISKIYTDEEYKIRTSVAGAGIGLATVFRSGGSFFFSSEAGVRTEVTVLFKRTDNFRDFKDQFKFISTQFYL